MWNDRDTLESFACWRIVEQVVKPCTPCVQASTAPCTILWHNCFASSSFNAVGRSACKCVCVRVCVNRLISIVVESSSVSHQLWTPVTTVHVFADVNVDGEWKSNVLNSKMMQRISVFILSPISVRGVRTKHRRTYKSGPLGPHFSGRHIY